MSRCQERGGWVTFAWETPDPDDVERSLNRLSVCQGSVIDTIWRHLYTLDLTPEEVLKTRRQMVIQMARYGRQRIADMDDLEVTELRLLFNELHELMDREHAATSVSEDA